MEAPTMLKLSARRSSLESQQGFPTRIAPSQFCQLPRPVAGKLQPEHFQKIEREYDARCCSHDPRGQVGGHTQPRHMVLLGVLIIC